MTRRHSALRALPLSVLLATLVAALVAKRCRSVPREANVHRPIEIDAVAHLDAGANGVSEGLARTMPSPLPTVPAGATMMHGGARRTHRARGVGPKAPNVKWIAKLPGAVAAQVTTSPDEGALYVASLDGTLTSLTRAGGRAWSVALGERAYGAPAVGSNGWIYVGSDAKKLFGIKPDGAVAFKLDLDGEVDTSPLVLDDGTVVVAAGNDVVAVRARGDVVWRYRAKGKVFTSPALANDQMVVFGSQDDHVYAVRGGELVWSVDVGIDCDGSPVVLEDGSIAVGTDAGDVIRIASDGKIVSRTKVGGFVRGPLSLSRTGDILVGTYGPVPRMVRIGNSGAILGSEAFQGTGAKEFGIHGGPLEDDAGALFFGSQDDVIYAYGSDGKRLWSYPTRGDVDAPLTLLSDGHLIAPSEDGTVTLFAP